MLQQKIQKTAATTMLAIFLSTGLMTGVSEAASHRTPPPPPSHQQQIKAKQSSSYNHRREHRPKHKKEKSAQGHLITGLLVGGAIGAVIAKNT